MYKKICFFTTHYDFPRQRAMEYYERILPPEVTIFLLCREEEKHKFNLKRTRIIGFRGNNWSAIPFIRKFCKVEKIEVITNLSGILKTSLAMALATVFTKTKNIFYMHGNFYLNKLLLFSLFQALVDRVLVCSEDVQENTQRFVNKNKVFSLPMAINTSFFKPKNKVQCRKKHKIAINEKVISFVGRIQKKKGSDYLLKIIKQNPDKKFILTGKLLDKNYEPNKLRNVLFIPSANAEQLVEYYSLSDLFLFLSKSEGYGFAPREAMSCGLPTIVSDIDVLRLIKTAIKVPFKEEIIQEQITKFFSLPQKKKKNLSESSRGEMVKRFSEQVLREEHIKYFLHFN